jgi:hypothetical protein
MDIGTNDLLLISNRRTSVLQHTDSCKHTSQIYGFSQLARSYLCVLTNSTGQCHFQNLRVPQLIKSFPAFYRIRHWSLYWATWIHSALFLPISLRSTLALPSYLCPGFLNVFLQVFPLNPVHTYLSPAHTVCPTGPIILDFIALIMWGNDSCSIW